MTAPNDRLVLTDVQAREFAAAFETPLYVLSEAHLVHRYRTYRDSMARQWPESRLAYASKANSTFAVIQTLAHEGATIDVASEGELRAALMAGAQPGQCCLHGSNKTVSEIRFALDVGIGEIVADNSDDIQFLIESGAKCAVLLRLAPGVDPDTHEKVRTGQADTKFGFNIADGSAEQAVQQALSGGLDLHGFHAHVGSQLFDPSAQTEGAVELATFAVQMAERHGFRARTLNFGGGLAVDYSDSPEPPDLDDYQRTLATAVGSILERAGLTPTIVQEPGRWLVAEAGVTLYTVGAIKDVPVPRRYVSVDGGLSDNPRPALYGSSYPVRAIAGDGRELNGSQTVTVAGHHCETDTLFPDIELPADLQRGDLLQVLVTGAYNASMASNYNRYLRPATAWIAVDGGVSVVQRRETWDSMFAREVLP